MEGAPGTVDSLVLPKVTSPSAVSWLDVLLGQAEQVAGLPPGAIGIEAQIEEDIERIHSPFSGKIGDVPVHQPGILRQRRSRDGDAVPVSLEYRAWLGLAQILSEAVAETGIGANRRLPFAARARIKL